MQPDGPDFFAACGLPAVWKNLPQWRVLDTHWGLGQHFLAAWAAWKADPERPRLLHFTAIDATPNCTPALHDGIPQDPVLRALATQLNAQRFGLLPGVHRLSFEAGRVLLTLWVGESHTMLRQQTMVADSIYLHGASSAASVSDVHLLKVLARHCQRGTQLVSDARDAALLGPLAQCGFQVHPSPDQAPNQALLQATFNPAWQPRLRASAGPAPVARAGHAMVIGAGLAGSAVARSLVQRGWRVSVLGAGNAPADGASGLPAGLFCPHVSPDDSVLSRLSRSGVRLTLQRLRELAAQGSDWDLSGVLEHCTDGGTGLPAAWAGGPGDAWSYPASAAQLSAAGLPRDTVACWHPQAGWVRPPQWVMAQLRHPRIDWVPNTTVARLTQRSDGQWCALNHAGHTVVQADQVVLAAGPATAALLPGHVHWPLQPIRGQITQGLHTPANAAALPPFPVNGNGNLVTHIPQVNGEGWIMGSTFERDVTALPVSAAEQADAHAVNLDKLSTLLPASAAAMTPWFTATDPRCQPTWAAVRVASHDRLPIVGPVDAEQCPGLWVSTAMGSRGLTLSVLCAELLAARWHGEPLPLDAKLALHLGAERLQRRG